MKEKIEEFLSTAASPETRNIGDLKEIHEAITGKKTKCDGEPCIHKMMLDVQKYYNKMFPPEQPAPERKYLLKDGNHSFYPGGPAVHNNDNTTDDDIHSHLKAYPHIKKLLK